MSKNQKRIILKKHFKQGEEKNKKAILNIQKKATIQATVAMVLF